MTTENTVTERPFTEFDDFAAISHSEEIAYAQGYSSDAVNCAYSAVAVAANDSGRAVVTDHRSTAITLGERGIATALYTKSSAAAIGDLSVAMLFYGDQSIFMVGVDGTLIAHTPSGKVVSASVRDGECSPFVWYTTQDSQIKRASHCLVKRVLHKSVKSAFDKALFTIKKERGEIVERSDEVALLNKQRRTIIAGKDGAGKTTLAYLFMESDPCSVYIDTIDHDVILQAIQSGDSRTTIIVDNDIPHSRTLAALSEFEGCVILVQPDYCSLSSAEESFLAQYRLLDTERVGDRQPA